MPKKQSFFQKEGISRFIYATIKWSIVYFPSAHLIFSDEQRIVYSNGALFICSDGGYVITDLS